MLIDDYYVVSGFCRLPRCHGGVCILANNPLKCEPIKLYSFTIEIESEFAAIRIEKVIIITLYRSPKGIQFHQPGVDPLLPTPVPTRSRKTIGVDLATVNGKNCIVAQDYYSKYPEVRKLKRVTSRDIIEFFKGIFAHHGIPEEVRSDNEWQFDS